MHRVEFHKRASKSLRKAPADRASKIIEALEELAKLDDPSSHANVIQMQGEWAGFLRMRVGSYRVIFQIHDTEKPAILLLDVYDLGPRGGIYG